jgi:septum formation protein
MKKQKKKGSKFNMLVLASASPRRKQLLSLLTSNFDIEVSSVDETIPDNVTASDAAAFLATKKALDVAKNRPNDIVIGADTIIVYKGKIYGKQTSKEDAKNMLSSFSGNTHQVITGVCVAQGKKTISFSSVNKVEFYQLTEEEIEEYLNDNEYIDKAGSYAIQGKAGLFIKEIAGDYNSIVGLPVSKLNRILKSFFNI